MSVGLARCGVVRHFSGGGWTDAQLVMLSGGCGHEIAEGAHALRWPDDDEWILWHAECCPAPHPHVWFERPTEQRMTLAEFRRMLRAGRVA